MADKADKKRPLIPASRKDKSGSWGYASGRVWCREKNLMGRAGLDRLYTSISTEDVRRLLLEHGYPQSETVEAMVHAERCLVYGFLDEVSPRDGYYQALVLGRDPHNLKLALKWAFIREASGQEDFKTLILMPGLLDADLLWRSVVRGDQAASMPDWAGALLAEARQAYSEGFGPGAIDRAIDRGIHAVIARIVSELKDPWLEGYFKRVRDLTNLELLLRARVRSLEPGLYRDSLLSDGLIDRSTWLELYEASDQKIMDALCGTAYQGLTGYFAGYKEREGPEAFSLARDRELSGYLSEGAAVLSGPPRVLAYVMARESEFKNTRIVMSALEDGLEGQAAVALRRDFIER